MAKDRGFASSDHDRQIVAEAPPPAPALHADVAPDVPDCHRGELDGDRDDQPWTDERPDGYAVIGKYRLAAEKAVAHSKQCGNSEEHDTCRNTQKIIDDDRPFERCQSNDHLPLADAGMPERTLA